MNDSGDTNNKIAFFAGVRMRAQPIIVWIDIDIYSKLKQKGCYNSRNKVKKR